MRVVSFSHDDYKTFPGAVEPLLERAALVANPRPGTEAGLYVPPSLFYMMAQGRWPGGMMTVEYVGHGMHYSMVHGSAENTEAVDEGNSQTRPP